MKRGARMRGTLRPAPIMLMNSFDFDILLSENSPERRVAMGMTKRIMKGTCTT
jgi:hypothetical protein